VTILDFQAGKFDVNLRDKKGAEAAPFTFRKSNQIFSFT